MAWGREHGYPSAADSRKGLGVYLILAIASALLFGLWQFAIARNRATVPREMVVFASSGVACLTYLALGIATGTFSITLDDLGAGVLGGLLNLAGTLTILRAYEMGKIGVVTGVGACYALIPLAYSFVLGERLGVVAGVGLILILVGLLIFYLPSVSQRLPEENNSVRAILVALLAAAFWGLAIIVLDLGTQESITGTMFVSMLPQVAITLVLATAIKKVWAVGMDRRATTTIVASGLAVALGQIAFFAAANIGDIGVVAILGSLSPLITALLALVVLHERMQRLETLALVVVVAGTALVAA